MSWNAGEYVSGSHSQLTPNDVFCSFELVSNFQTIPKKGAADNKPLCIGATAERRNGDGCNLLRDCLPCIADDGGN